ncbi:uncharacterized protein LOC132922600 isoform X2 [Rhopalosiphum padi]|uniref:uncharacterized protein LOC132922600 isoform X2 n=1 Tax=Rhopalosiphum padi TaxID=40932 RepID=UPI00298D7129|nr:uncharacterized protein LOC132922600 isoform X2 [Rhopalosiphum padi]
MQFQVTFAVLAAVMCFAAAAPATEEVKSSPSASAQSGAVSDTDRSKRFVAVAAPYVAAPYAAAPYVAAPYAAAPYALSSPYASPYVSSYTTYPYVAKTLASPYTYYP